MTWHWWTCGSCLLLLACGPTVGATDDGVADTGAQESSSGPPSTATTEGVDASSSGGATGDTDTQQRRCLVTLELDVAPGYFTHVARLRSDTPMHLLFVTDDDALAVVGGTDLETPWTTVQTIPGMRVQDRGDIDGDGLDDVVMVGDPWQWWSADASGLLSEHGPLEQSVGNDVLLRLPGDPYSARAHAGSELELRRGNGDGTFTTLASIVADDPEFVLTEPMRALHEGLLVATRTPRECLGFCEAREQVLRLGPDGTADRVALVSEYVAGIGDIEPDGVLDVFVRTYDDTVGVLRGTSPDVLELLGAGISMVIPADLDGDGASDLVVREFDSETVGVLWNDGGTLAVAVTPVVGLEMPSFIAGAGTDVDADGASEAVIQSVATSAAVLLHAVPCG